MAIPTKITLYQDNDQFIRIVGLTSGLDPTSFFTDAVVTATLRDPDGNIVEGLDGVTLFYVPNDGSLTWSEGTYMGSVQETFEPPIGGGYVLQIDAEQDGVVGNWFIKTRIKIRRT